MFLSLSTGTRRDVTQPLEDGEGEIRRRHLEGKALADEPGESPPGARAIGARNDAAGAVAEQEDGQAWIARFASFTLRNVAHIIGNVLDIKALAFRFSAPAQIERIDREAGGRELLGRQKYWPPCELTPWQ